MSSQDITIYLYICFFIFLCLFPSLLFSLSPLLSLLFSLSLSSLSLPLYADFFYFNRMELCVSYNVTMCVWGG